MCHLTRNLSVKNFRKPEFVLTGLSFCDTGWLGLLLSSWLLGKWLERIVPQRCWGFFRGVDGLCACGLLEGGVTRDLGFWCLSGLANGWVPTPHFLFPVPQRILHSGWPLCSANPHPHPISSPSAYLRLYTYLILARSLSSLVLHVTLQREFQSLCLSRLGFILLWLPF